MEANARAGADAGAGAGAGVGRKRRRGAEPRARKRRRVVVDDVDNSEADPDAGPDEDEDEDAPVVRRPKRKRKVARDRAIKFARTGDPYNIPPDSWTAYSRWIVQSKGWFPAEFGGALVDFAAHCHHYTADQWRTFAFHVAPIMLRPRARDGARDGDADSVRGLPLEDYLEFTNLVKGVKMAVAYKHTKATIDALEDRMHQFSRYVVALVVCAWARRLMWRPFATCAPTSWCWRWAGTRLWNKTNIGAPLRVCR